MWITELGSRIKNPQGSGDTLYRMVRKDLFEEAIFEKRLEWGEVVIQVLGKSSQAKENSVSGYKGKNTPWVLGTEKGRTPKNDNWNISIHHFPFTKSSLQKPLLPLSELGSAEVPALWKTNSNQQLGCIISVDTHIKRVVLWKEVLTETSSKAESTEQGRSISTAIN